MKKPGQSPRKNPRIEQEPVTGALIVGDYIVGQEVLGAILDADARVLWQFRKQGDEITATPYGEDEVIWVDKKPEDPGDDSLPTSGQD